MRIAYALSAVAVTLVAVACGSKAKKQVTTIPAAPVPPVGAPLVGITFMDGWTNPHALPDGVNTPGWEDSSNVSADGKTLYFSYTQYDQQALATSGALVISGPPRPGEKGPAFDIYEATIDNGAWNVADSTVNSADPNLSEAASGVDVAQDRMVFVNFATSGDLYLSSKVNGVWQAGGTRMPSNVNSACVEDDPTMSADGKTVWFDSDRTSTGCGGNRQIWVTHDLGGGAWSDPVNVTPGAQPYANQAFVSADGSEMYWSGIDNDCLAQGAKALCLYKAPHTSGDGWGTPQIEALMTETAGVGVVTTIGESSVTADGKYLYFTDIVHGTDGRVQLNLGVAQQP